MEHKDDTDFIKWYMMIWIFDGTRQNGHSRWDCIKRIWTVVAWPKRMHVLNKLRRIMKAAT